MHDDDNRPARSWAQRAAKGADDVLDDDEQNSVCFCLMNSDGTMHG